MVKGRKLQDSPWLDSTDTHELAWAAGFFDGEGTFGFDGRKAAKPRIRLQVSQKDVRLLERFEQAVGAKGGKYYHESATTLIFNKMGLSMSILNAIWPYLGPAKREQFFRTLGG